MYDLEKTSYVLEIEALGVPRLVGPFASREEAFKWAEKNIRNGEYNAAPVMCPEVNND